MSQPISAHTGPIEEETVPNYSTSSFYPVHIGHIYHKRYQVEVKLGYGGFSTVWLCRDQKDDTYKVLKVATWSQAQNRESEVLKYLKHCTSQHHGQHRVRRSCDSFTIKARGGLHQCLVFEPLGRSLAQYVELQPGWRLTTKAVAQIAKDLLLGLDYMHSYLVVHADLKPANILLSPPADGDAILTRLINAERADPSQRKVIDEQRTIYTSRAPEYGNDLTSSIVCDLGLAVFSRHQNSFRGRIQALPYRAPEVILDMRWGSSADIWSLGVMLWQLLFAEHLFGSHAGPDGLRLMIAYLGLPPRDFLKRSRNSSMWFDKDGAWKGADVTPIALHDRLVGPQAELFLDFIKSILRWVPEERAIASTLLRHPWLNME